MMDLNTWKPLKSGRSDIIIIFHSNDRRVCIKPWQNRISNKRHSSHSLWLMKLKKLLDSGCALVLNQNFFLPYPAFPSKIHRNTSKPFVYNKRNPDTGQTVSKMNS